MRAHHDELFKHTFSRSADAASELRAVLPRALVAAIDWSTLELMPQSFVDVHLREKQADLLYRACLRGRATWIYFLLEHKSRQKRFAPLQVLGYKVRIWERHHRDHPEARYLPRIHALVIHHGKQPWRGPPEFASLFDSKDQDVDAESSLVQDRFILDDLTTVSEQELWNRSLSPGMWLTLLSYQRSRRRGDLCKELAHWRRVEELVLQPGGRETLAVLVLYNAGVHHLEPDDEPQFVEQLREWFGPETDSIMGTLVDRLLKQGHKEGHREGGADLLLRQLRERFGPLSKPCIARVRQADRAQLERWAIRVLSATSLADVDAELVEP